MTPLAEILRPSTLDDYVGQRHLVGQGAALRSLIESGHLPSMILWGPPGTGKTTLAMIISRTLNRPFHTLSAVSSGVKEVREAIEQASREQDAILFIDEIHRFNKGQQDSLLGAVEKGIVTLIGATTENPSFEVVGALLSRCQVFVLKEFDKTDLEILLQSAMRYYASTGRSVVVKEEEALLRISGGDGRKLLNALELAVNNEPNDPVVITNAKVTAVIQQNLAYYDKQGEMHYDIVSAFIKSMRGSDPNGTAYWLARMVEGGEDPLFIARRMLIFASEDVGNANPNALLLANACFDAVNKIGYPECRIVLSQTAIYLANSLKSNSTYTAIGDALKAIQRTGDLPVPLHLRNAPTKLTKQLGYAEGYKYAHDFTGNFVEQEFLPDALSGTKFYEPGQNPREEETRKVLKWRWKEKYHY
ncbi:MAG: replication-associated recombination protein A [Bacteroidales bacterium]|nr:replication-associated recombination protein A [Bacteroidales bacterium]